MSAMDISVIIPCLNERETIAASVRKAREGIVASGLAGEVVVVDNGSTDGSAAIAESAGGRVVREERRGYGSAYLRGIADSTGRYLVLGDADDTYDFRVIPDLIKPLRQDADMVLGSRLKGTIQKGAMSFSHRHIGN